MARIEELEARLIKLERELQDQREKEREREIKNLRTGLIAAGGIIIALAGFFFTEIIWPVIKSGQGR